MKEQLEKKFEQRNATVKVSLIPDPGNTGNFEVKFNDEVVHSRRHAGGFALLDSRLDDFVAKALKENSK